MSVDSVPDFHAEVPQACESTVPGCCHATFKALRLDSVFQHPHDQAVGRAVSRDTANLRGSDI